MALASTDHRWRDLYASDYFRWQQITKGGRNLYYRHLGIVENLFDLDGIDWEGRADINIHFTASIQTKLSDDELRERIMLAWSYMRHRHPLLSVKSLYAQDFLPSISGRRWIDKCFVYEKPSDRHQAIESARQYTTFVEDFYNDIDIDDFYTHLMNTGRPINAEEVLAKLFVLPFKKPSSGPRRLDLAIIVGHEIADGMTVFRWTDHFIRVLNMTNTDIVSRIDELCSPKGSPDVIMPAAQEALYPVYAKNTAQNRWNWAITRILRHVRRPPPAAFPNPCLRDTPRATAEKMPEVYPKVLNYSKIPPLNSGTIGVSLPPLAYKNLIKLCRQAGISIGSGAFTLTGLVMMRLEEARNPNTPTHERAAFVGSFPVNPRPFLSGPSTNGKEDSLMLAFSDGVTLPFIPSTCDVASTFRVLGRLAHRQLRQYQKRPRSSADEAHLGSRSPRELLPILYLSTMERLEMKARPENRVGFAPQAAYPAKQSPTGATCGISSIGDRGKLIAPGQSDTRREGQDLVADFVNVRTAVRPRDGEFLVGAIGTQAGLDFLVSYDASAIDPAKALVWKEAMMRLLDFEMDTDVQNLRSAKVVGEKLAKL